MKISKCIEITGHSGAVYSLAFDQKFLYSASADKYVTRWNINNGEQDKFAIKFDYSVYSVCILENHSILIAGLSNGNLHFFNLEKKEELKFYTQHKEAIFCIVQDPVSKNVIVADAVGNLSVWSSEDFRLLTLIPLNCGKIRRIGFMDSNQTIILSCQDGNIRVLDRTTLNELNLISAHPLGVTSNCILLDGALYTGGKDAFIRKWNNSFEKLNEIPAHNYAIYDIVAIQNFLLSASRDKSIKVWDKDLQPLAKLDFKAGGHRHSVNALHLLGDTKFASASDDGKIIVWEVNSSNK